MNRQPRFPRPPIIKGPPGCDIDQEGNWWIGGEDE